MFAYIFSPTIAVIFSYTDLSGNALQNILLHQNFSCSVLVLLGHLLDG